MVCMSGYPILKKYIIPEMASYIDILSQIEYFNMLSIIKISLFL